MIDHDGEDALVVKRPDHVDPRAEVDFDIYNPPNVRDGFHAAWKTLQNRAVSNIVWTPRNGGHWIATSGHAIKEIFADNRYFSSRINFVPKAAAEFSKLMPSTMDPPEHRPVRNLLNANLSPKAIGRSEGWIRDLVISLIEGFRSRGECNFTAEYAEKLPIQVFLKIVDLPIGDGAKLKFLADEILRPTGKLTPQQAMQGFFDYLDGPLNARIGGDGEDLLSRIANSKIGDRALTRFEMLNMSVAVLIGGLDTVVNFLGFMMDFLAQHPAERRRLAANPDLIPIAVEEFIRRFPVVTIGRVVKQDVEYEGVTLKAGDMVMLPTVLHGLDDRENDEPMAVRFNRDVFEHSTFGNGIHRCAGIHLARSEIRITLKEWLVRIPEFEVAQHTLPVSGGGIVGSLEPLHLTWATPTHSGDAR
jgi:camphor 5-monooxygenase